jgi:hypothetical protein
MSEIQSENIKPESSVVNPTELSKANTPNNNNKPAKVALSKARTSKNNKPAKVALSKARTSKNNKPAQATHSSDELKNEVRFRKAKKISKSIKRIESEMSYIQSQMTRIAKDLNGIVRLMQDKGRK